MLVNPIPNHDQYHYTTHETSGALILKLCTIAVVLVLFIYLNYRTWDCKINYLYFELV